MSALRQAPLQRFCSISWLHCASLRPANDANCRTYDRSNQLPVFLKALVFLWPMLWAFGLSAAGLVVRDLRCEYLKDPLGIDTPQPRLSWVLASTSRSARASARSLTKSS